MKTVQVLARIDPYPFQHRVGQVMRTDVPLLSGADPLSTAVAEMARSKCSAILVADSQRRVTGIVTERDAIDRWAALGERAGRETLDRIMSGNVVSISKDAFIYAAIARMNRRSIRHLPVIDPVDGTALGILELRGLLRWRAEAVLGIGDDIAAAPNAASMHEVFGRLPALAGGLRREHVPPSQIAAIVSGVYADMTARASELAAEAMTIEAWGPAPAPWCMLVLGSAGRGESLLAADQDNALIHAGIEDDHAWFAEFGRRAATILNEAGVPFCRGEVMAMNRELRHNGEGWRARLQSWFEDPRPVALLNADIFYDFLGVAGKLRLARELRDDATKARNARLFLNLMAAEIGAKSGALDWFGRFRQKNGRIDLKIGGLFPIVAGGRVLALKLGAKVLSSQARWRAAFEAGILAEEDLARLIDAHEMILGLILDQQLADLAAGAPATSMVAVKRLLELDKERLRQALRIVGQIDLIVGNALRDAAAIH